MGHGVLGVGLDGGEGNVFGALAGLRADGVDDAGEVGEEEGGVGGDAVEDVVEDGGGVGVARAASGGVEEDEGGAGVLLGLEELKKAVGRQGFGELHHGTDSVAVRGHFRTMRELLGDSYVTSGSTV